MTFVRTTYQDLMTFGRTTHDTVLDSDGKLKTILNRLNPSTDLTDTDAWAPTGLDSVVASGTGAKGKTRYLLTEESGGTYHYIKETISFTAGEYIKISVDAESNGRDLNIYLSSPAFDGAVNYEVDFTAGTVETTTTSANSAAFITPIAGDEYRIDVYVQASNNATSSLEFYLNNSGTSYSGDGSSGVYLSRVRVMKASVHAPVERVTNGTFDTDISGWTKFGDAATTIAWNAGGYIDVNAATYSDGFSQAIATIAGETYRVEANVTLGTATEWKFWAFSSGSVSETYTSSGVRTFTFTATGSSETLAIVSANSTGTFSADNISVTKVITDGMQLGSDGEDFVDGAGPIYVDGRAYDGNGASLGKQCFEGRTNLITYSVPDSNWKTSAAGAGSTPTVTLNAAASPSGDLDAAKVVADAGGATTSDRSFFLAPATTHTASVEHHGSVWLKGNVGGETIVFRHVGESDYTTATLTTEWQRFGATETSFDTSCEMEIGVRGSLSDQTATFYVWQADITQGSSPVPSIPTNGSAVARGADSTYKLLNEFGFRQDQYSVLAEFQSAGSDGSDYPQVFSIEKDGTAAATSRVGLNQSNTLQTVVSNQTDGNVAILNQGTYTADTSVKVASAFKQDDFSSSDGGDAVVTDTAGNLAAVDTLQLGSWVSGNYLNGYLKRLVVWPTRLADATLVEQSS